MRRALRLLRRWSPWALVALGVTALAAAVVLAAIFGAVFPVEMARGMR